MKKIHIILIIIVALALLLPTATMAGGTYYCSTYGGYDGDGSMNNPWSCRNNEEFRMVWNDRICGQYSGGVLYRMYPDHYMYHRVTWYAGAQCGISDGQWYPGYPPYTGPDFPTPLVISAVVAGAAILLAAGTLLRRRSRIS